MRGGSSPSLLAGLLALAVATACRGPMTRTQGGSAQPPATTPAASAAPAGPDAAIARPVAPAAAVKPGLDLRWLPDGRRVLVGGRLLLDEHGQYGALAGQVGALEPGAPATRRPIFSPDATRALLLADAGLHVGDPVAAARPQLIAIPPWLAGPGAGHQVRDPLVFWLGPQLIFAQRTEPEGRASPACGSYDLRVRRWNRLRGACLTGAFDAITEVDLGPGDLLALHSSAEGHAAIDVVRYRAGKGGQADTGTPPLVIEGSSLIRARFAGDGTRLSLVSPCVLEGARPPPCEDFDRQPAWRLYERPIGAGPLRLVRADLPPGTALSPRDERFAWPRGDAICLGDPRDRAPACYPLPPPPGAARP